MATCMEETASMHNRVFVYGTLKSGEPNHHYLTNPEKGFSQLVGKARTCQRWPLVIATEFNIPFLLFKEGEGELISGEVYDVDQAMMRSLDELEDYPTLYVRYQYEVELKTPPDGEPRSSRTTCWIYFLTKFKDSMMDYPFLEEYSSMGEHGLEYVARYLRAREIDAKALREQIQGS